MIHSISCPKHLSHGSFIKLYRNPASPGEVLYQSFIVRNAPRYRSIPDTERKKKTDFTRAMVKDLIENNFVLVQFTQEGQYFQYDMTNKKAFIKVRGKIGQAMLDISRGVDIATGVAYYNPLPLINHAAGADVVQHPLPPLDIQPQALVEYEEAQIHTPDIQMNAAPVQDSIDKELQRLGMEDMSDESVVEIASNDSTDNGSDIACSNDEREELDDNWSIQMSLYDECIKTFYQGINLLPGNQLQNVFENPEE